MTHVAQRDHIVTLTIDGASVSVRVPIEVEPAVVIERARARVFPNERVVQFIPPMPEKKRRTRR